MQHIKMSGEPVSTDAEAANTYPEVLKKMIEEGRYRSQEVFKVIKIGLC